MDSYSWFKGLVQSRRKLDDGLLNSVADGRVFTGRQAVNLKLIDSLGNEKTALEWLQREKNIPATTPVRDVALTARFSDLSFLHMATFTLETVGLPGFAQRIETWGRSARSRDSTLTVYWRFGTLRLRTERQLRPESR